MFEYYEDDKCYYLITAYCNGGDLFDEMQKRGKFVEKDAAIVIRQILSCINYLHQNKIAHRDIKPENILIEDPKRID